MNYRKIIGGYYYYVLGYGGAIGLVTGILLAPFTDSFRLDFSFVLWLIVGYGLRNGSNAARRWAIGISAVTTLLLLIIVIFGIGEPEIGGHRFTPREPGYYLVCAAAYIILGVPGLLLLSPAAKKQFTLKRWPSRIGVHRRPRRRPDFEHMRGNADGSDSDSAPLQPGEDAPQDAPDTYET